MARRPRVQYPDAIYHVMTRGSGRRDIVRDDEDRDRLRDELGQAALRCNWRVYAFVILSNHLHVVLKTPQPNLARGMQAFLSSYANVWLRRHGFSGQIFRGRYRTDLLEDESYLWCVTRHVHLNPVRAGLVEQPRDWAWSSYPGYARKEQRWEWVAYDELLSSCGGTPGGSDPAGSYRRYVSAGLSEPLKSPWTEAHQGWILGSGKFVDRVGAMLRGEPGLRRRPASRPVKGVSLSRVCDAICTLYGVKRSELRRRGNRHPARAALAYLARRRTAATNLELADLLGLSRAESVPNLTRRFRAWVSVDPAVRRQLRRLDEMLDQVRSPE
jgi:putative transposase